MPRRMCGCAPRPSSYTLRSRSAPCSACPPDSPPLTAHALLCCWLPYKTLLLLQGVGRALNFWQGGCHARERSSEGQGTGNQRGRGKTRQVERHTVCAWWVSIGMAEASSVAEAGGRLEEGWRRVVYRKLHWRPQRRRPRARLITSGCGRAPLAIHYLMKASKADRRSASTAREGGGEHNSGCLHSAAR